MNYEYAIETENLRKEFSGFTLGDINFKLPKGYITGLVGENGAGKTTLINLVLNTLRPTCGSIYVMGRKNDSPEFTALKNKIGVVLDEAMFPWNVNAKVVNKMMTDVYEAWEETRFFDYLNKFSLPREKAFKDFSKGMKMKLSIAVALSHNAELLILDEPTGGLDPLARDEILDVFYEFTREEKSILISSHIVSDLEKLCDYIAFLHEGKMVFCEEKDGLPEKYGIFRCSEEEGKSIREEAIAGKRQSKYSSEFLVKRDEVSPAFNLETPTLEEIILFMGRKRED